MEPDGVDFVVAAYLDEADEPAWQVEELDASLGDDLDDLTEELRRVSDAVIGLVSVADDFFVVVRLDGSRTRLLLSDVTAVGAWPLADAVADVLDVPDPDDDETPQPAGELDIVSDLGLSARELGMLCDDDLYPEEVLGDIAERLGFGPAFEAVLA